jgi:S1-C subfamily serine protease
LSRFCLYREDQPVRKVVAEILSDSLVYLRVSRQPVANRVFRAFYGLFRRLMYETTLLFRVGVILAIVALGALAYQQNRLNVLLQQRIESGATELESFAGALTRAKEEALTPNDLKALRQELGHRLSSNAERLADLERRSQASARVIAESMSSVVFLQGAYGFRERSSGRMLRHVVDDDDRPLISPIGQPLLSLDGDGPVAERQFTGTGFAVGDGGALVTNRHVALPWEKDANVEALADQGLEPVMIKFIVYVPGKEAAGTVELVRASEDADLAVLRRKDGAELMPGLKLADAPPAPGDEVIVMGYPTGLRSMLAQSGKDFIEELQKTEDTDFWSVAARLAAKGHIAPLASRGIVGQVTRATIVYDAETTHGGSGGPVLDIDGSVVAVNAAILPDFGGSNLGVPVAKLRALLEDAGLR